MGKNSSLWTKFDPLTTNILWNYFSNLYNIKFVGLSESVKKKKFVTKIFFTDNIEWSSKNNRSADVKANKNNKK